MDFHIIPECYVDTNLIETIVPPNGRGYNHQKGCATVAKTMREHAQLRDGFAVGIIDKDKKELDYALLFEEIVDKGQLKLLKHPQKHHYFILIVPAMEKWILSNAAEVGIDLIDFDLSNDLNQLRTQSKKMTTKHDPRFKNLFRELKRKEASGVMILQQWISYLKDNNYAADMNYFKD
jgi:hypothetical protein